MMSDPAEKAIRSEEGRRAREGHTGTPVTQHEIIEIANNSLERNRAQKRINNENATVEQINAIAEQMLAAVQAISDRLDLLEEAWERRLAALEHKED